eukprot:scaffold26053_cov146-Isochrysis_galbana.AAC.1
MWRGRPACAASPLVLRANGAARGSPCASPAGLQGRGGEGLKVEQGRGPGAGSVWGRRWAPMDGSRRP